MEDKSRRGVGTGPTVRVPNELVTLVGQVVSRLGWGKTTEWLGLPKTTFHTNWKVNRGKASQVLNVCVELYKEREISSLSEIGFNEQEIRDLQLMRRSGRPNDEMELAGLFVPVDRQEVQSPELEGANSESGAGLSNAKPTNSIAIDKAQEAFPSVTPRGSSKWVPRIASVVLTGMLIGGWAIYQGNNPAAKPAIEAPSGVTPAGTVSPKKELPKSVTNTVGIELLLVPAGEFLMGADASDSGAEGGETHIERPQHRVRITRPFYLGAHEVTRGQFLELMDGSKANNQSSNSVPAETIYWSTAAVYCNALSDKEGIDPYYRIEGEGANRLVTIIDPYAGGYRLPTEAEWEYACRAGSSTRYSFGDDANDLKRYAWFDENASGKTHPVGEKLPNPWGFYDMHGNVWEWCWDLYDEHYYTPSPIEDPLGPDSGTLRIMRGGSVDRTSKFARSAWRGRLEQTKGHFDIGFRVARFADEVR